MSGAFVKRYDKNLATKLRALRELTHPSICGDRRPSRMRVSSAPRRGGEASPTVWSRGTHRSLRSHRLHVRRESKSVPHCSLKQSFLQCSHLERSEAESKDLSECGGNAELKEIPRSPGGSLRMTSPSYSTTDLLSVQHPARLRPVSGRLAMRTASRWRLAGGDRERDNCDLCLVGGPT